MQVYIVNCFSLHSYYNVWGHVAHPPGARSLGPRSAEY